MKKLYYFALVSILLTLTSVHAHAQIVPDTITIYGPDTVCADQEYDYYVDADSLPSYFGSDWVINNPGTILNKMKFTTRAKWLSPGFGQLEYRMQNFSNQVIFIGIKQVVVLNAPKPRILANFKVQCQKLGRTDSTEYNGFDTSTCIRTCAYNCVTYYAKGDSNSTYEWDVFGGSVTLQDADSCIVCWNDPGMGLITIKETNENGCIGQQTYCVEIIESPIAYFVALPDTTLRSLTVCDSTEVIFLDKSIASSGSPIVSWRWDFGDGSYSNAQGSLSAPVTHMYTGSGSYTVTLTVTNKCGCSTTETMTIDVDPNVRLKIECPRVVCDGDTAVYSVNTACTTGTWTVLGGTTIATTATSVLVVWDAASPSGFGYVVFDATSCGQLCAISTVKVPVVLDTATITGPTVLCPNSDYIFKLPQWPTTKFTWYLNATAVATLSPTDQPNEIIINTATAESLVLTCSYINTMLGCGGIATLNINVLDPIILTGPDAVCYKTRDTFRLSGTNASTGSWVLTDPISSTTTGSGSTFTNYFDQVGTYVLNVTGSFCPVQPKLVRVDSLPPIPDYISGVDSFCRGVPARFDAGIGLPATSFNWAMDYGAVNAASGAYTYATMNALPAPGPFIIYLWRETRDSLHCHSDTLTKQVYPPTVAHAVVGDTIPCVSNEYVYQSTYAAGEYYKWRIEPQTMGSVRSGDGTASVNVLWNNASGTAKLICEMRRCFTTYIDTLIINVGGQPSVVYSGPSTICGDDSFTVSVTNATATFDFDDGTGSHTNGTGSYKYKYGSNLNKVATLTINVTTSCGLNYIYSPSPTITIHPTPMGTVTPAARNFCYTAYDTLEYHFIGNAALKPLTFQWYKDGVLITGATDSTYILSAFGNYWIQVTSAAPDSCTWKSDTVKIQNYCPCYSPRYGYIDSYSISDCNEIYLSATYSTPDFQYATWEALQPLHASLVTSNYSSATFVADAPGYYTFKYTAFYQDTFGFQCQIADFKTVVVHYVPILHHTFTCNDSASHAYRETKLSTGVALWPGSYYNHEFFVDNVLVQNSTQNTWTGYLTTGYHTAKLRSSYNGDTCEISSSFTVVWDTVGFTFARDTTCEKEASVQFTNTSVNYSSSLWDFDDLTYNTATNPARVYNSPGTYYVKLTITDQYGCQDSVTDTVVIVQDMIDGTIAATPSFACPKDTFLITYARTMPTYTKYPSKYIWYNGLDVGWTTDTSYWRFGAVTGMWWLYGYDTAYGCITRTNAVVTEVTNIPKPYITGSQDACVGEDYTLNGYAGSDPNISYRWMVNGTIIGSATSAVLTQNTSTADTYAYRVLYDVYSAGVGGTCTDTSEPYIVTVHAKPSKPVPTFSILDCNKYEAELTATHPSGATETFNWSNGLTGSPVTTYYGGPYQLVFTDSNGCTSDTDFYLPKDPREYLWIFPTGCWSICPPDTYIITGPIISFSQWDYLKNTVSVHGSTNNVPTDYLKLSIDAPGIFNLYLDNGYCDATSGDMVVDTNCSPVMWSGKPGRNSMSISEIERRLFASMTIIPNPADNGTKVDYTFTEFNSPKCIEIYDMTGRLINRHEVINVKGSYYISLDKFVPGLYQLVMRQDGEVLAHKRLSVIK